MGVLGEYKMIGFILNLNAFVKKKGQNMGGPPGELSEELVT